VSRRWQLWLHDNKLTGEVPAALSQCVMLRTLTLYGNCHTGPLPEGLGALRFLEELGLHKNAFSGAVPASLASCTRLRLLKLDDNEQLHVSGKVRTAILDGTRLGGAAEAECRWPRVSDG
jgi:Leucine-rich repeat (LRR) protein